MGIGRNFAYRSTRKVSSKRDIVAALVQEGFSKDVAHVSLNIQIVLECIDLLI